MRVPDSNHVVRVVSHHDLAIGFRQVVGAMGHDARRGNTARKSLAKQGVKVLTNSGRESRILADETLMVGIKVIDT